MNLFFYDIFLSGLTYVVLIYLAFKLMRKGKPRGSDDDGGNMDYQPPKIDLPPGVIWPDSPKNISEIKEEVLS